MLTTLGPLRRAPKRRNFRAYTGGEILPVTFPTSPLTTRVHIALGADLTASWLTWNWLDITDRVRHDLGISVNSGRGNESGRVNPSRAALKVDNNDGYLTRLNPLSPYFGQLARNTPIWIELDPGSGFVDRFHGYITEWPTRWADQSGTDATVTMHCSGVLRRLAQGEVLKAACTRAYLRPNNGISPYAYWSFEDVDTSGRFTWSLPGDGPRITTDFFPGSGLDDDDVTADSTLTGSGPVAHFPALTGTNGGEIPTYTDTGKWAAEVSLRIDDLTIGLFVGTLSTTEPIVDIRIDPAANTFRVRAWDGVTTTYSNTTTLDGAAAIGDWIHLALVSEADSSGTTDRVTASVRNADGSLLATVATTLATATSHAVPNIIFPFGSHVGGVSVGHLAFYNDPAYEIGVHDIPGARAMHGWTGEQAHERVARLCREEGIPVRALAGHSAAMGLQPSGSLLDLLRQCEASDGGVLYEHEFGLAYQALSERYGQPVSLELDFDARHIIMPTPADDDQRLRNEWTIARLNGSTETSSTYRDDNSVAASGLYDDSATVNVQSDSQLGDVASWRVHIGTVDEYRWPGLPIKMHGSPDLIPQWLATGLGDRMTVDNPPAQLPQDQIDLVIEGYAERWDTYTWDVSLQTSPASPYRVAVLDDASLGKLDSGSSSLTADISDSATSFQVTTTNAADLWTTDAAELPITLRIGGEDMTIPAGTGSIAGASSPQTFSGVVRAVNGVTKAHSAGAQVNPPIPARLAL